jgi:hypothetical protein
MWLTVRLRAMHNGKEVIEIHLRPFQSSASAMLLKFLRQATSPSSSWIDLSSSFLSGSREVK